MRACGDRPAAPRGRGGFALLEALVALAIIGVFASAVLATLGAQVRAADRAAVRMTAQALAEDRQMTLELLDRDDLESLPDTIAAGVFPPPFDDFTWLARAEAVEDEDDLFATEVIVSNGPDAYPLRGMIHRSGATIISVGVGQ